MGFVYFFSLSCLAAILLATGAGHLAGFRTFCARLREHRTVRFRLAVLVAGFIVAVELAIGPAASLLLAGVLRARLAPFLFIAGAIVGIVFLAYARRLLRRSTGVTSCGCTPLSGPLTPASLIPAAVLALVSCSGLVCAFLPATDIPTALAAEQALVSYLLPVMSGVVFAGITILAPASMPPPLADVKEI